MKRLVALLLAAGLMIGITGCQSGPSEEAVKLTAMPELSLSSPDAPDDCFIKGKELTEEERQFIRFLTTDSVSLFSFVVNPEWGELKVWVEPYHKGVKQPNISLRTHSYPPDEPIVGDMMIKVRDFTLLPYIEFMCDVSLADADGIPMGSIPTLLDMERVNNGGHAYFLDPVEIVEDQEITLRIDTYSTKEYRRSSDSSEPTPNPIEFNDYIYVFKCTFSKPTQVM